MVLLLLASLGFSPPEPIAPPSGFRVAHKVEKYNYLRDRCQEDCLVLWKNGKVVFKNAPRHRPLTSEEKQRYQNPPGKVVEKEFTAYFYEEHALRVDDGWLSTVDFGEWGGGVYWFSRDWKTQERLFHGNANKIDQMKDGLYCLGGLAHLGSREGYLLSLKKVGGKWRASKVCDLPTAPEASCVLNSTTFLFALDKVYQVDLKGKTKSLFAVPDKLDLISTIQVQDGYAYLGGRKYIAAVEMRSGKVARWYEPAPAKPRKR